MRYRYTVELTVDELDFSATEAEHLRAALREAAEEYATGEVKVLCEDGMRWLINALPGLRDWLADWRLERRNRKAIRRLWRAYGRKPPHGL